MNPAITVTALTLVYWGILFTLTHIPVAHIPETVTSDKLLHFMAYLVLAVMVGAQLFVTRRWNQYSISVAVLVLILFGGFDELTQMLVGRSAEWKDWGADLIGIFTGMAFMTVCVRLLGPMPFFQALIKPEQENQTADK